MKGWIRRGLIAAMLLIAALGLAGCGQIASSVRARAAQMWVQCPVWSVGAPSWSPDGTQIAIVIKEQPTVDTIALIDPDVGTLQQLANVAVDSSSSSPPLAWSPDGGGLAYAYDTAYYIYNVAYIDVEGGVQTLLPDVGGGIDSLTWSPDGQRLALSYHGPGEPASDLYVINRTGEILWRLSDIHPEVQLVSSPAWSPDGTTIAFVWTTGAESSSLAVIDADGNNFEVLRSDQSRVSGLQWSPDGQWIANATYDPSNTLIEILRSDGTEHKAISVDLAGYFSWMPDNESIIYPSMTDKIMTVSLGDGSKTMHASFPVGDYWWAFSPNGTRVAYVQNHGQYGAADLFVMNIDGTDVRQLTHNPGNRKCFQWPF